MTFDVSVVIPTYNRIDLLTKTVDTVVNQSMPAKEIIIVDDGSSDGTTEKMSAYHEKIKVIRIENSGEMIARNKGVSVVTGKYIAFCDSDDLWEKNHLENMMYLWKINPSINAAFANFRIVRDEIWSDSSKFDDAPADFWRNFHVELEGKYGIFFKPPIENLVLFNPFFPSAMVVRTDFFRSIGGWDEAWNRKMSQDFATTLRVAEHPPIGLALRPTVGIRKHSGNFSGDVQKMNLGDAAILDHALRTRPSLAPHADAVRRSILARRTNALEIAFSRQDFTAVAEIAGLVGEGRLPQRARLKARLARLPGPLRRVIVPALLGLGTLRARLRQG
jgi:hypothetical protein